MEGATVKPNKHFDVTFLMAQKHKLLELRTSLLNRMKTMAQEEIAVPSDEVIEEGDQAQTYLNQNIAFGLKQRELNQLREIEAALERIQDGSYGVCEETEEPIAKKRLEKMPWTRLSIQAAEALERDQQNFQKIS
jgi:DnaK suppressor protein